MPDKLIVFTPTLFFQYAICPDWIWHDRFSDPADKGQLTELTLKLFEQGVLHEKEYIKDLQFAAVTKVDLQGAFQDTMDLMSKGADLIYQGVIQFEADGVLYRGRPDLLKKMPGQSKFGNFYYYPIDIKSSKEAKKEQEFQLVLYSMILENLQNIFPDRAEIININKETIPVVISPKVKEKAISRIYEILDIIKGQKPPLKLVSECKNSPWYSKCVAQAEAANDLALIHNFDSRGHQALRDSGINTVKDIAAMEISLLPKVPFAPLKVLERIKIQAHSLITNEVVWLSKPDIPNAPIKIYFDIEGDPLTQVEYLFGFWVVGDPEGKYAQCPNCRMFKEEGKYFIYFIAESPEDEQRLWNEFLQWVKCLPHDQYYVYHYADYERSRTLSMAARYSSSEEFIYFCSRLVDLMKTRERCVIFPLYFYSIKDIAKSKFVNFKWRHAKEGGAQSISWYKEWLESNDRNILNTIIDYNEDDVRATEFFHKWLLEEPERNKEPVIAPQVAA
jgi:uncharacterized protein